MDSRTPVTGTTRTSQLLYGMKSGRPPKPLKDVSGVSRQRQAIDHYLSKGGHRVYGFTTYLGQRDDTDASDDYQDELLEGHLVGRTYEITAAEMRAMTIAKLYQAQAGGSGISPAGYELALKAWESKSSPKLRRWLWDHSDFESESARQAVAIIAPTDDLGEIAQAGFAVMDREQMSAYKPTRPLPKKPKSEIEYPVTDVHGNSEWMSPDEISQRFEKIAFGNEYNQDSYRPQIGYPAGHRTLVALKHSHGENIGVVQVSYRQTTEAAERRIGLEPVSVRQAEEAYVLDQFDSLTTEEGQMLVILYGDRFASGPYEFGSVPYGVQRRISERQQIIAATREVAQEHGLALPGDFEETEKLIGQLTEPAPLDGLRKKIAANGENPATWLSIMAPMVHTVSSGVPTWPRQTEEFIREVSGIPEGRRQRAMIAGLLMIGPQEEES